MQDLSKKIKFYNLRRKLWRSKPYRLYVDIYDFSLKLLLRINKRNVKIIFINGMRRSGNHYLMKTLLDSTTSTVIFYNNQNICQSLDGKNGLQVKLRFSKTILLIIGYEDVFINNYLNSCDFILNRYFQNNEYLKLLIIRDVRNIMASRLNHAHMANQLNKHRKIADHTKELWADHHTVNETKEYLTIHYEKLYTDMNSIDLNRFSISKLIESTKILNRYGGGSSFETKNFNERYSNFIGNETYEYLIKDYKSLDESTHQLW